MNGKRCFNCKFYKKYFNSNEYFCSKGYCFKDLKIKKNNRK